jgi:hypothetical protein
LGLRCMRFLIFGPIIITYIHQNIHQTTGGGAELTQFLVVE